MDVRIETKCGRCDKAEETTVSLEKAQELQKAVDSQEETTRKLTTELAKILGPGHPDIIIATRKNGEYSIRTLNNLCNAPEAKRNKGCAARVEVLLDDIFQKPAAKKKTAPKKPVAAEAVEVTEATTETSNDSPRVGKHNRKK